MQRALGESCSQAVGLRAIGITTVSCVFKENKALSNLGKGPWLTRRTRIRTLDKPRKRPTLVQSTTGILLDETVPQQSMCSHEIAVDQI